MPKYKTDDMSADDVGWEAARQRKRDATAAEASSQNHDGSMLDDMQLDDDDTVDPVELVAGAGVKGRVDEDLEEVDTSHGLVGIHEAILMSIDKCGQFMPSWFFCRWMLCCHAMYVRPSIRLSVTFVYSVKTSSLIFKIFPPSDSHTILVFHTDLRGLSH